MTTQVRGLMQDMTKIIIVHLLLYGSIHVSSSPEHPLGTGTFWQITDIHWDQQYSVDGDPAHMCHKKYALTHQNSEFGNYACDSPWPLVKSAIQTMVKINNRPDFILWTGDNVPHTDDPEPDFSVIFSTITNITGELRTAFVETVPILPVLGNHDAYPKDFYPVAGEEFYGQYLTKGSWSTVLSESAQEEFKVGGYYGYDLPSNITVLVVNTNLYYAFNKLGIGAADPCGQFAWLKKKLQQARDRQSKVIIAAHAPPGYFERFAAIPFFNATYNAAYVDLIFEYGDVVMAQIYGHEHTDSFRLFSSSVAGQQSVGFLAPSVTPWFPSTVAGGTAINPSLRHYLYNQSTLLDYNQYHLNLSKVNSTLHDDDNGMNQNTKISKNSGTTTNISITPWELYYQARQAYGLTSLDFNNMAELHKKMEENDTIFQTYYSRNSAGYDDGTCDSKCKRTQLCAITSLHIRDMELCLKSKSNEELKEHISPLEGGTFHLPSTRYSNMIIAIVAISMTLMMSLAVTVAVMLVLLVLRNHRAPGDGHLPICDFTWRRQRQRYNQLA